MADNLTLAATMGQERFLVPFLMDRPEIATTWFAQYGSQGMPQFQILRNLGMQQAVTNHQGKFFMQDRWTPILYCAGALSVVVAPSSGVAGQYSFVLDTTSGSNDLILGAVAPDFPQFGSSNYYYQPAIIGMGLIFKGADKGKSARIYNITGEGTNTVTIFFRMDQINTALTGSYGQGTPMVISSNSFPSGNDMPKGTTVGTLSDTWTLQNIWDAFDIDGDELTTKTWIEFTSKGEKISGYYSMSLEYLNYRHAQNIDNALWDGAGSNNPLEASTQTGNQNVIYKTEGQIPYTRRTGTVMPYPIGALNPLFLDQIDGILVNNFAPKHIMIACDNNFSNALTNAWVDYLKFTQIDFVVKEAESALFKELDETGKSVKVDFQYIEKNNRTYCKNVLARFNDPNGVGAPGYYGNNFAYFCPIGTQPDPKNGNNKIPYFGLNYKSMNGYNRMGEVGELYGAVNGQHTQSVDQNKIFYKSQIGAMHVGGINMIIMEGQ